MSNGTFRENVRMKFTVKQTEKLVSCACAFDIEQTVNVVTRRAIIGVKPLLNVTID